MANSKKIFLFLIFATLFNLLAFHATLASWVEDNITYSVSGNTLSISSQGQVANYYRY